MPSRLPTELPTGYTFTPLLPGTPLFADAMRLYLNTWPSDPLSVANTFTRCVVTPDYHGLAALYAGRLVGFGIGARSLPGDWWHDQVAARVGVDHPALQDAWALVDLAVAREHRGRGVGSALMEALLREQPCPRALLSTEVVNAGARRLYERHGWRYLHPGFAFNPGDQRYAVMRRELDRDA